MPVSKLTTGCSNGVIRETEFVLKVNALFRFQGNRFVWDPENLLKTQAKAEAAVNKRIRGQLSLFDCGFKLEVAGPGASTEPSVILEPESTRALKRTRNNVSPSPSSNAHTGLF